MRTIIQVLIIGSLTLGMAYAQETTESAQPVVNAAAVSSAEPAPVAVAAAPIDIPAVLDVSREQYVAGDYVAARKGFENVLIAEPGNPVAQVYMKQMEGRKHRDSEEAAIETVNSAWNGMILRDYPLSANILQSLRVAGATNPVSVTAAFPEISFPKDAYAIYRPRLNRLFVLNTSKNMEKIESIIASMDAPRQGDSGQVKIEARFVEFNEGALQELGFEWKDNTDNGKGIGGKWSVENGQNLFSDSQDGNAFNDSLRTLPYAQTGALGLGETRATGVWRANRIEDMFNSNATGTGAVNLSGKVGGNEVDLLIKALDQTSGADVLSAPSVTTLSGQPAVITVGERHFYPETYDEGVSQGTVLHVKYEDFKEKILGVEMTVTPTIKGDEIQMKINPKINELLGWQKFEISPADTSYTYYQYRVGMQFEHDPVVAQLPLFNRREVKTEVSVASGSTVGMGGLIGEKTEAFSDRVPVLGSIPLIGRIFRSEGSRTVKRNLMIFVTASKVAPNGRIISERSFEK